MAQINLGRVKGDKGDPFLYEDFTEEQLAALKGENGKDGITPELRVRNVTTSEDAESVSVDITNNEDGTVDFDFEFPDASGNTTSFSGTTAEYEAQKNEIEDGTVVNITDDIVDGELLSVDTLNRLSDIEDSVNDKVNKSDILTTMEQISANTTTGKLADATVVKELSDSLDVIQKGIVIPVIMSYRHTGGVYQGIIYSKNIGELTVISAKTYNDDNWAEIILDVSNIYVKYVEGIKAYLISIAFTDCGGKLVELIFG